MSDQLERLTRALEGRYTIERELGRGGMGVVYLGQDTGLDRPVAIKVLPEHLAGDPERLARFEREAKLLASLNHPNIAGIYGIEEVEGHRVLILEFIEGETLGKRLENGALSVRESLQYCSQIAAAVEAAHESGVIHRDLKPGNVHITPSDEVKVLDFGLAKGTIKADSSSGPADSPTLTFRQATGEGVILGTTSYLSPEQARGKAVNRRADIWAFGCILYECLTGEQAFIGETTSDTIAQILEREVDLKKLPERTPVRIRELISRCLEKDEKKRQRDIGDARIEIQEVMAAGESSSTIGAQDSWVRDVVPVKTKSAWARASIFTLVGAVLASAAWILIGSGGSGSRPESVTRFQVAMPTELQVFGARLSRNGQVLLIAGRERAANSGEEAVTRLYRRPMGSLKIEPIEGTERERGWVDSQDGKMLAFVAPLSERTTQKKLARVPIDGSSPPVTITEWHDDWQSTEWLHNGDFIITTNSGHSYFRLPAGSTTPEEPIEYLAGETKYSFQIESVLPGDRGLLLTANSWQDQGYQISVAVLDLKSGEVKFLFDEGGEAKYSGTGHIVFSRGQDLLAAPFDLGRLEVKGEPVAMMTGLRTNTIWTNGNFSLAKNGALAFAPGGLVGGKRTVAIVDADKEVRRVSEDPYPFEGFPTVSANGRVFASVAANANGVYEVWGGDLSRPRFRKLAAEPKADCGEPVLSPDGKWLAYQRFERSQEDGIYMRRVDGSGTPIRLVESESRSVYYQSWSWSPDGSRLIYARNEGGTADIYQCAIPTRDGEEARISKVLDSPAWESAVDISPDGGWLAFETDETGKHEVYVATYDADGTTGLPVSISDGEGHMPKWSRDGKRLYYVVQRQGLMVVDISTQPSLSFSDPKLYLPAEVLERFGQRYETLPGGRLLVVLRGDQEDDISKYEVVLNWTSELGKTPSGEVAAR